MLILLFSYYHFKFIVGPRDYTSLSKDTIFVSRYTNRFTRWEWYFGKVGKEQTKTDNIRARREIGKRIEGCQICWMLGIDTSMYFFFILTSAQQIIINIICLLSLQKGLKNVFDEAILAALEPPEPAKKKRCKIL